MVEVVVPVGSRRAVVDGERWWWVVVVVEKVRLLCTRRIFFGGVGGCHGPKAPLNPLMAT